MTVYGTVEDNKLFREKDRKSTFSKLSNSEKDIIRKKVHDFFTRQEIPTLKKIVESINSDENLPNFSKSVLHRILKKLGFLFKKRERDILKTERVDLINWRKEFIESIRKFRAEGRKIYYTDETWLNANHTVNKTWVDATIKTRREAFVKGLSTGLNNPSGKGKRLIISHIGSSNGFVEEGLLCFESKKNNADYHDDMDGETYENWFGQILNLVEKNSVIVLDNAPYHSVKLEKIPNTSSNKSQIVEWLHKKNIEADISLYKKVLLDKVNEVKPIYDQYKIDQMARDKEITLLRLPPYHCQLNAIELIWAQVKGQVARNNNKFDMAVTQQLLIDGFNKVTAEDWENCVKHVIEVENLVWAEDHPFEVIVNPMIIVLNEDDGDDEDEDDFEIIMQ